MIGSVRGSFILINCFYEFIFMVLDVLIKDGFIFLILVYVFCIIGRSEYKNSVIIVGKVLILIRGISNFNKVSEGMVCSMVVMLMIGLVMWLCFVKYSLSGIEINMVIIRVSIEI